jgi:hypothetical protein
LIGQSPQHRQDLPVNVDVEDVEVTPKVTKSGRVSKPVTKFDPTVESRLQKDTQTAIKKSVVKQQSATKGGLKTTASQKSVVVESEKSKRPKTTVESEKSKQTKTVIDSEKSKQSKTGTISKKSAVQSIPVASKSAIIAESVRKTIADIDKNKDITERSTITQRTPVKDDTDISKRSTKTARTPKN